GRSDQLTAGLERAVDPNDDGDAHDAARIALVSLAAPFAGFADGPEALAAEGALALDTLVVAPAGNDGAAGAGYGDVSGPGGGAAVLTVGAIDARTRTDRARVVMRPGPTALPGGAAGGRPGSRRVAARTCHVDPDCCGARRTCSDCARTAGRRCAARIREHRQRRAGSSREFLVLGARVRRGCEAGPRRTRCR